MQYIANVIILNVNNNIDKNILLEVRFFLGENDDCMQIWRKQCC